MRTKNNNTTWSVINCDEALQIKQQSIASLISKNKKERQRIRNHCHQFFIHIVRSKTFSYYKADQSLLNSHNPTNNPKQLKTIVVGVVLVSGSLQFVQF